MPVSKEAARREVSEKAKLLLKAIENDDEKEAIQILESVGKLAIDVDLLKETRIGIVVNRIRRNGDSSEELKKIAKQIVSKWKSEIFDNKEPVTFNGKSKTATTVSQAVSPNEQSRSEKTDKTPKNCDSDKGNLSITKTTTNDSFRDKCIGLLHSALDVDSCHDQQRISHLASVIEQLTFDEYGSSKSKLYKSRIQSIRFNLKDKNNPELRNSLINGEISCEEFSRFTTQQMASAERKLSVEKAKVDAMNESVAASSPQAETDMFQCGNCKKRRCKYSQMQTRSSDEPMTTFVSCLNCGKRWKFC